MALRFDNKVVVITGAGGGLGRAYALFFASRGARVVANDLGAPLKGEGSSKAVDLVVNDIRSAGGHAIANYDSVEHGDRIIDQAVHLYGRIDILINNAGILRDVSFAKMSDRDWDLVILVHVYGAYKCARAAWPHFRRQKYGRLINTASAAGLYGNFGQSNYSAAKMAMVGLTETLAREGQKYNILANVIAPMAASRMTETVLPPDILDLMKPDWVTPLVGLLAHQKCPDSGAIFEVGGGRIAKMRWERAHGLLLKCDASYTPGALLGQWLKIRDFSCDAEHPIGPNDFMALLDESAKLGPSPPGTPVDFTGKVVLVTGGGAGIGRVYCLAFAKAGASVVVNDVADPMPVVNEIKAIGSGRAHPIKASAEDGDALVQAAIDTYGRIDVLVNNAGILRDKAFANMDDRLWQQVLDVHLRGTYKATRAAWPHMVQQKYGRIVNTTSTSGIYGNFGQANYAAAKSAIIGFSKSIALEGVRHNILVNTIAPNAGTAMTATIMPPEMVQAFKPDYIAPLVLALCSDAVPDPATGGLYEVGSGWVGATRWQQTEGVTFPTDQPLTPEAVAQAWSRIVDFDNGRADHPDQAQHSVTKILANAGKSVNPKARSQARPSQSPSSASNPFLKAIAAAKKADSSPTPFAYSDRDSILYNLGIGAKRHQLPYVYEGHDDFQLIPTFGVIPPFSADLPYKLDELVPNFSPMMLLHGEQYLEIRRYPVPTAAKLVTRARLLDVIDKRAAAVVRTALETCDEATGEPVFYNEMTVFLRGCGGFGGPAAGPDRGASTAVSRPPARMPDVIVEEATTAEQAAVYRLSGDYNPLHIDPDFAKVGGFRAPILHGLCTFGIAGKAVYERFGRFANIKVRFAGTVVPGQTLVTEMWKGGPRRVVFQTKVKETGKLAIGSGAAELWGP